MNIYKSILRINIYWLKIFFMLFFIKTVYFLYFSKHIINLHLYNCTQYRNFYTQTVSTGFNFNISPLAY